LGIDPDVLGPKLARLVELDWPVPKIEGQQLIGEVESIDRFGNLVTNISRQDLARIAQHQPLKVSCGAHQGIPIVRTYSQQSKGTIVALVGSNGHLELAVVEGNAADAVSATAGMPVTISW
jgi:S-adenosylmethionine hydrolase